MNISLFFFSILPVLRVCSPLFLSSFQASTCPLWSRSPTYGTYISRVETHSPALDTRGHQSTRNANNEPRSFYIIYSTCQEENDTRTAVVAEYYNNSTLIPSPSHVFFSSSLFAIFGNRHYGPLLTLIITYTDRYVTLKAHSNASPPQFETS